MVAKGATCEKPVETWIIQVVGIARRMACGVQGSKFNVQSALNRFLLTLNL